MASAGRPIALLKAMLVRVPLILKTVFLHGIRMSPVSGKQDLRTELTVAIIRSFIDFSMPVGKQQKGSMRDPGIKGPMWVSKVTLAQPENDVQEAVFKVIEDLKQGGETYEIPGVGPVEAEWTGHRRDVGKNEPQPDISEEEKFRELRKEAPADMAILYFHGGAHFLMDPCTHRVPVSHLSKLTGAPVLSVRYRLAPQNPFPAAIVDALVAYLSLIAPPPGSLHEPVSANKIVISGDSAGGNLSLALLQTLLSLRRVCPTVRFHGKEVPIELPAGLATISPWCDITRSMPSVEYNAVYDYLGPPSQKPGTVFRPVPIPEDEIWPCNPPRADIYANANALLHPLTSPLAARKDLWKDAPPIFITMGEEGLSDEGLILARRVHQAGAPVITEQFEGMPHCFGLLMVSTPAGRRFFQTLSQFCRDAAAGRVTPSPNLTYIGFGLQNTKEIPLDSSVNVSDDEADELMRRTAHWKIEGEKELQRQRTEKARL